MKFKLMWCAATLAVGVLSLAAAASPQREAQVEPLVFADFQGDDGSSLRIDFPTDTATPSIRFRALPSKGAEPLVVTLPIEGPDDAEHVVELAALREAMAGTELLAELDDADAGGSLDQALDEAWTVDAPIAPPGTCVDESTKEADECLAIDGAIADCAVSGLKMFVRGPRVGDLLTCASAVPECVEAVAVNASCLAEQLSE